MANPDEVKDTIRWPSREVKEQAYEQYANTFTNHRLGWNKWMIARITGQINQEGVKQ